jgi:hypothetical protein
LHAPSPNLNKYAIINWLRTPVVRNASTLLGLNQSDDLKIGFRFIQNQKSGKSELLSIFAFHLPLTGATYLWLRRADTLALRTSAFYYYEFF